MALCRLARCSSSAGESTDANPIACLDTKSAQRILLKPGAFVRVTAPSFTPTSLPPILVQAGPLALHALSTHLTGHHSISHNNGRTSPVFFVSQFLFANWTASPLLADGVHLQHCVTLHPDAHSNRSSIPCPIAAAAFGPDRATLTSRVSRQYTCPIHSVSIPVRSWARHC